MSDENLVILSCPAEGLLLLLATAASVDGEVTDIELLYILNIATKYYGEDEAKQKVDEALASWAQLGTDASISLALEVVTDVTLREIISMYLVEMILADDRLHESEEVFLTLVTDRMSLKKTFVNSLNKIISIKTSDKLSKEIWIKKTGN